MLAEYRVLMLTLVVLVLKDRSWLLTTLVQCGIFSFSQEKLTVYRINNLYPGNSRGDKLWLWGFNNCPSVFACALLLKGSPWPEHRDWMLVYKHRPPIETFTLQILLYMCLKDDCLPKFVHILLLIPSYKPRFEHFSVLWRFFFMCWYLVCLLWEWKKNVFNSCIVLINLISAKSFCCV